MCVCLFLTASASLRTRSRLFPRAALTSTSVHPLLSSSATTLGTLDTSSRSSGSLREKFYFLELIVSFYEVTFFWCLTVSRSLCSSHHLNVLYSPCNTVVISTKTDDVRPSHFLYMVKVSYDGSSKHENKADGHRKIKMTINVNI